MLEKWWRRCWFKSADKPGGCGLGIEWLTLAGSTQLILIPQRIAGWLPVTPKMPHIDRPQQLNHLLYILKVTSVQPKQLRWLYCGVCGLGVVASTDRTFSGTASIRLGSWEHAGQINALSWGHWHWGVAWRFFFLVHKCLGGSFVSTVKLWHPIMNVRTRFPGRILTLHWMIKALRSPDYSVFAVYQWQEYLIFVV